MLELVENHRIGKPRLLRLLDEIAADAWCQRSLYLTPQSLIRCAETQASPARHPDPDAPAIQAALRAAGASDTGVALFLGADKAIAVCPPFPLASDADFAGANISPLTRLTRRQFVVGVILLRLGRYAVGVVRGDRLAASKTESRYVKNRHRAGGQSQRRFERSRERLIRELYDKTCQTARAVFEPFQADIDYIMLGGESTTLMEFAKRCPLLSRQPDRVLGARLAVDRPNRKALDNIAYEAWKSRVYVLQSVPAEQE